MFVKKICFLWSILSVLRARTNSDLPHLNGKEQTPSPFLAMAKNKICFFLKKMYITNGELLWHSGECRGGCHAV
jgi:hypothetical protein